MSLLVFRLGLVVAVRFFSSLIQFDRLGSYDFVDSAGGSCQYRDVPNSDFRLASLVNDDRRVKIKGDLHIFNRSFSLQCSSQS